MGSWKFLATQRKSSTYIHLHKNTVVWRGSSFRGFTLIILIAKFLLYNVQFVLIPFYCFHSPRIGSLIHQTLRLKFTRPITICGIVNMSDSDPWVLMCPPVENHLCISIILFVLVWWGVCMICAISDCNNFFGEKTKETWTKMSILANHLWPDKHLPTVDWAASQIIIMTLLFLHGSDSWDCTVC